MDSLFFAIKKTNPEKAFFHQVADLIEECTNSFFEYNKVVSLWEITLSEIRLKYKEEPQEMRVQLEKADKERKNIHDKAIDSVNILNRIFVKYGQEPLFIKEINGVAYGKEKEFKAENKDCRRAVRNFCFEFQKDYLTIAFKK